MSRSSLVPNLRKKIQYELKNLKDELHDLEKNDRIFRLSPQVKNVRNYIFYSHTVTESGIDFLIGRYVLSGYKNSRDKALAYFKVLSLLNNVDFFKKVKFAQEKKLFEDKRRLPGMLIVLNNYRNKLAHLASFSFVEYKHPILQKEPLTTARNAVLDIRDLLKDKTL